MATVSIAAAAESVVKRRRAGKHTPAYAELRRQVRALDRDNTELLVGTEDREREIHTALLRGCQDAMVIAQLRAENLAVKAANEEWRRATIRAKAEQERLRRAVVNARPRITEVDTRLVRPFSPVVAFPYASPVPYRDTSNDETQELPILDQPQPWPTYRAP